MFQLEELHFIAVFAVLDTEIYSAVLAEIKSFCGVGILYQEPFSGRTIITIEESDPETRASLFTKIKNIKSVIEAEIIFSFRNVPKIDQYGLLDPACALNTFDKSLVESSISDSTTQPDLVVDAKDEISSDEIEDDDLEQMNHQKYKVKVKH